MRSTVLVLIFAPVLALSARGQDKLNYARDIQPILAENCFACHGFDEKARKAKLRLDTPDGATAKHKDRAAIVPGQPDQSEAIRRILTTDPDDHMPPEDSGKKLTARQIESIKLWISQGADYTGHWSFQPIKGPAIPAISDLKSELSNPIDAFILQKLRSQQLQLSSPADKQTLIRRVTLDLTGLPPTLPEIDAFLADASPDAYERVVDRLLKSPHYGERMALDWLDAARYADTHGYHIDAGRDMTAWREWVINAFNANMPFDRFTVEQLAGDLLPNATTDQRIASGFNRNHMINFEGGAVPEEYHTAYLVDRVNTTGTVWLGLTVACAQCHDHKYDPIKQREYYQLYAFFNNLPEKGLDGNKGNANPVIKTPTAVQRQKLDELAGQIKKIQESLDEPNPEADAAQAEWEKSASTQKPTTWTTLNPAEFSAKSGSKLEKIADDVLRASGPNPAQETYTLRLDGLPAKTTALRFEMLPDDKLAGKGPGRSVNGNVVLTEFKLLIDGKPVKLRRARADFAQKDFPASNAIDGNSDTGWALYPEMGKPHHLIVEPDKPLNANTPVTVVADFHSTFASHQPGRFRLSFTDSLTPAQGRALPEAVVQALAAPVDQRTADQITAIRRHYRSAVSPAFAATARQITELEAARKQLDDAARTTMVMQEMPTPRETHILLRGQYDKPGDAVSANTPTLNGALPPLRIKDSATGTPNRLDLARWIVGKDNPLTARVIVNRYWQAYFGTGIVKTSEDLGTQGEWPTHPELLDYLASRFVASGWDVKAMQRLIVTSQTYRQSSKATPELISKDPENRLLARGPRVRLPAEFIRDQALAISGLLDPEIGGASVFPYQPAGLWEELMSRSDGANWTAQTYTPSHGKDLYRRTMYTFWKRTSPPPTLHTFDAPDREVCTVRRSRTNTPLQALVLMNDPTYLEASRKLAEHLLATEGSDDARLTTTFRLATARTPTPAELTLLTRALAQHRAKYRAHPDQAQSLLRIGDSPVNEKLDQPELAAWTMLSSILLNLDEAVTKN